MHSALANFQMLPLKDAARQLFAKLGYKSEKFIVGAGSMAHDFLADFATGHSFDQAKTNFFFGIPDKFTLCLAWTTRNVDTRPALSTLITRLAETMRI